MNIDICTPRVYLVEKQLNARIDASTFCLLRNRSRPFYLADNLEKQQGFMQKSFLQYSLCLYSLSFAMRLLLDNQGNRHRCPLATSNVYIIMSTCSVVEQC